MIKTIHLATVAISISLFFLRGIWRFSSSAIMQQRWVKIVPHVNDAILLTTAIILSVSIAQYPFVQSWLTAKVIALLFYILLGMVAFKWGRSRNIQMTAWLAAMAVFAYIVLTALQRNPYWFMP